MKTNKHYITKFILLSMFMMGCYNPEDILFPPMPDEEDKANKAEPYNFNVAVLSEWGGNISPFEKSIEIFFIEKTGKYYSDSECKSEISTDLIINGNNDDASLKIKYLKNADDKSSYGMMKCEAKDKNLKITQKDIDENKYKNEVNKYPSRDETTIEYFIPGYSETGGENNYTCEVSEKDGEDVFECGYFKHTYKCSYYTSGLSYIEKTMEELNPDKLPQIKVGTGDSFGVSADISASLADIPTVIALNALGFTADTLGNHSFDGTLESLKRLIEIAKYPFVASNLSNVPQNLAKKTGGQNVYPYVIAQVKDKKNNDHKIGIVSAIDPDIATTVYAGKFGTLNIMGYCPVVHALEEAYNEGARSFIVLAHVTKFSKSMTQLFDTLFALKHEKMNELDRYKKCTKEVSAEDNSIKKDDSNGNNLSNDGNEADNNPTMTECENIMCKSVLLTNNSTDNTQKIRKFIFDNIIAIIGEGHDELPVFVQITENDYFNTNEVFADLQKTDNISSYNKLDKDIKDIDKSNEKDNAEKDNASEKDDTRKKIPNECLFSSLPCFRESSLENKEVLTWVQSPTNGTYISSFDVEIKDNSSFIKNFYASPVVFEVGNSRKTENDCSSYTISFDSKEENNITDSNILKVKINGDSIQSIDKTTEYVQGMLECVYNESSRIKCTNGYCSPPIYVFENGSTLFSTSQQEDRKQSTIKTSLIADIVLRYVNLKYSSDKVPDFVLMNAGAIRELKTDDVENDKIILSQSTLNQLIPYDNGLCNVTIKVSELVEILNFGFKTQVEMVEGYGGFPVVSGINVYLCENDNNIQVKEIWKTDLEGNVLEPIYIRTDCKLACKELDNRYNIKGDVIEFGGEEYKLKDKVYESEKIFNMISPDYLATGGDKYDTLFTRLGDKIDCKVFGKASLRDSVRAYFKKTNTADISCNDCSELNEGKYYETEDSFSADELIKSARRNRIYRLGLCESEVGK